MVKLKLTLNSTKPSTVYARNGKSYTLKPGSNTLNLEYEDYVSLAQALAINPVENKKPDAKEDIINNQNETQAQTPEPQNNSTTESIDYSTWSLTKLKAEYKSITGNTCKLKKEDIILFLQEHSNAE